MCRFRRVRNLYRCGHAINLPEEEINCEKDNCIFSTNHPATCTGETCRNRCWQYHQFPEQYTPHIGDRCPNCNASGPN